MEKTAIKPDRGVENAFLSDQKMKQLVLEGLGVFRSAEITAEFFSGRPEAVRDAVNDLAGAYFMARAGHAGFAFGGRRAGCGKEPAPSDAARRSEIDRA